MTADLPVPGAAGEEERPAFDCPHGYQSPESCGLCAGIDG